MTDTTDPLAHTSAVVRRFGEFVAVDEVDLDVRPGEVVGLLGANGAGKTTLIRLLLGLLRPSAGTVALFGEPPSRHTRRRLGYVPQSLGLYDDLTAEENLAFAQAVFGRGDGDASVPRGTPAHTGGHASGTSAVGPAAVDQLQPGGALVGDIPLGIQRRLAFAQALAHRPDLLVLDEPTSGVDPLARARLWETVRTTAESGAGVLVTTHHLDEAEECDRLVIMATGRVVAEGTVGEIVGDASVTVVETEAWSEPFDILDRAGLPAALVGRSLRVPGTTPAAVRRALGDQARHLRIAEAPATLQERFFELVATSTSTSDQAGDPRTAP